MPLLLLLLLIFTCQMQGWQRPFDWQFLTVAHSATLTAMAMSTVVLFAWLTARWTAWALHRYPDERDVVLARYGTGRFIHFILQFTAYGLSLFVFGWGWAISELSRLESTQQIAPGAELLLLLPFLASMVLSWCCFYSSERAIHDTLHPLITMGRPFWSRFSYVAFHARQNLAMVLVPILLLVFLQGASRLYPDLERSSEFQYLSFGLLLVMFLCLPLALRLLLGLYSLPPGELRDRLEAAARRLHFRCRDILVWNTRQGVANAMVVGLLPRLRFVVLTDRLLLDLTADEVEAVFGHEVGHVKHQHMPLYFSFLSISLMVLLGVWELIVPYLASGSGAMAAGFERAGLSPSDWTWPMVIASLVIYIFVVFGFLSRRCERQADIYGCRAVSCGQPDCQGHDDEAIRQAGGRALCPTGIKTFVSALEKVAELNGISRSRPGWLQSWQHSTIARRVEFLQHMLVDPAIEPRFQRRVFLVKWGLMVGLCALLVLVSWTLGQRTTDSAPTASGRVAQIR